MLHQPQAAALYCPEAWLADWWSAREGGPRSVWAFEKTGAQPLLAAYRQIVRQRQIDTVTLVDGGIDLILRGDESSIGTPAEDLDALRPTREIHEVTLLVEACRKELTVLEPEAMPI